MSGWAPKRFWKSATVEPCQGGFTVRLDGRAVKTPAKALFVLPTLAMAQAAAAEWDVQEKVIRPEIMPVTRAANSAIDKVTHQFDDVVSILSAYGESDLLCYRATGPEMLITRQAAAWDPLLHWSEMVLHAPLTVTKGIIHVAQPADSLARLRLALSVATPCQLVALHDLIAITGSLILGLAVAKGRLSADQAFDISRIDEQWQVEQWGQDIEASGMAATKRIAMRDAVRILSLCE